MNDYEQFAEIIFNKLKNNTQISLDEMLSNFNKGEIGVLSYLAFDENKVTSGTLSEKLNVTTPRMASILNSLENKGYIKRICDETDRRKSLVTITQKGNELAQNVKNKLLKKIILVIKEVDQKDVREYIRISAKIKDILNKQ